MNPHLGLSDKNRAGVIRLLQPLLADEFVLSTKTRQAHWNVTGPHFSALHAFFGEQYAQVAATIDDVAERIRALGGVPAASLAEYVKLARLKETPSRLAAGQVFLKELALDHEAIVRQLRQDIVACGEKFGDAGTNDFLTGLMESHEKTAWMLRASLKE